MFTHSALLLLKSLCKTFLRVILQLIASIQRTWCAMLVHPYAISLELHPLYISMVLLSRYQKKSTEVDLSMLNAAIIGIVYCHSAYIWYQGMAEQEL